MDTVQANLDLWRGRARSGRHRRGATLVAVILSLLLLLLLAALVASAVWTARGAAKRAACTRNLEKLVGALHVYAEAHGGLPPAAYEIAGPDGADVERVTWKDLIKHDVGDPRCFICPADESTSAAEKSRPPESRASILPCSYEYVWQQPAQEAATDRAHGARPRPRDDADPSHHDGARPLLVCRHHDTPKGRLATWCLVAYSDGSIAWERRRPAESEEPSPPASEEEETSELPAIETTPRGSSSGKSLEPGARSGSRSDATREGRAKASEDRRSR